MITEEEILGKEHTADIHFEERHGNAHEAAKHGVKTNSKGNASSK